MLKVLEFKFDKSSKNWYGGDPRYNLLFLRSAEEYFNVKLKNMGRVTLDEVLNYLGIEVPAGLGFYGWDYEFNNDKAIMFGLQDQIKAVSDGKQNCVYIRFNINTEKEKNNG